MNKARVRSHCGQKGRVYIFVCGRAVWQRASSEQPLAQEGDKPLVQEPGQRPTEVAFNWGSRLATLRPLLSLLLRLILLANLNGQQPLSPSLGRLGSDVVQGAEEW